MRIEIYNDNGASVETLDDQRIGELVGNCGEAAQIIALSDLRLTVKAACMPGHDSCQAEPAPPLSYPNLNRIAEVCQRIQTEGVALKAAVVTADAVLALDVYRQAVLKALWLLKRAEARGGEGASCICPEIHDVLETARLQKRVTPYQGNLPNAPWQERAGDDRH